MKKIEQAIKESNADFFTMKTALREKGIKSEYTNFYYLIIEKNYVYTSLNNVEDDEKENKDNIIMPNGYILGKITK